MLVSLSEPNPYLKRIKNAFLEGVGLHFNRKNHGYT